MSTWSKQVIDKFAPKCPEIEALPPDWYSNNIDNQPYRIYFISPDRTYTTWDHPTLGPLPDNWQLHLIDVGKNNYEPRYRNLDTDEIISTDPRFHPDVLNDLRNISTGSISTMMASGLEKNSGILISELERAPVTDDRTLRDAYEIVHTIDSGDGRLGAMNGGVFVVKMKGLPHLYVEKRFKQKSDWDLISREVEILRRIRHGSMTMYCAAFIDSVNEPNDGSLYVEFCDRGSLEDIIKRYIKRRRKHKSNELVPEPFVWHALLGLADGFAYLQGGRSYINDDPKYEWKPEIGWLPILHRDTKPDNILLKSRSSIESAKYFYCILTDFGLACEDDGSCPHQTQGYLLGTPHYLAPELCWHPYAHTDEQKIHFPIGARHSSKSDIWALGACMLNLAQPTLPMLKRKRRWDSPGAHLTFEGRPTGVDDQTWLSGRASRRPIAVTTNYSTPLKEAIALAGTSSFQSRPDAINFLRRLLIMMQEGKIKQTFPQGNHDQLPGWATKAHDHYYSRSV